MTGQETRDRAWFPDRWDDVTREDFETWRDEQDDEPALDPWHETTPEPQS